MLLGIFNSRLFRNVNETAKGIHCIAKTPICMEWPWLYDNGTYEKGKDSIKAVTVLTAETGAAAGTLIGGGLGAVAGTVEDIKVKGGV